MTIIAVDTDAIHKLIVFGLADEASRVMLLETDSFCALNATKYVLRSKIKKSPPNKALDLVMVDLEAWFDDVETIEPTEEEASLAAELELLAQTLGVSLDIGESLLCAVLINRSLGHILTGDKRAIVAAEKIFGGTESSYKLDKRLICLEQVILMMLNSGDPTTIKNAICSEPDADKAVSICFSCSSPEVVAESWVQGLESYIAQLKDLAPTILYPVNF